MGRGRHRADHPHGRATRSVRRRHALAAALPVPARGEVQGHRQHGRGREFHLQPPDHGRVRMKTDLLSMSEELLWRAEVAPQAAPPFIECARHVALIVQWEEPTDLEALTATFTSLLTRHPVLRSTYAASKTGPLRIVAPVPREPVSCIEIDGHSDDDRWQQANAALASAVQASFNVERGPLIRARLLRMNSGSVLAIVAHHLVFDVVSRAVFWQELQRSYAW